MRSPRRAALALSAVALAGALSACGDQAQEDVPIMNDPAEVQQGDTVAPASEGAVVPTPAD